VEEDGVDNDLDKDIPCDEEALRIDGTSQVVHTAFQLEDSRDT